MILRISGNELKENCSNLITILTAKSFFLIDSYHYDDKNAFVEFLIRRRRYCVIKKYMLGLIKLKSYEKEAIITSTIRIKNVDTIKISNKFDDLVSEFQILIGIKIKDNEIIVSSVEENQGIPFFLMVIKFSDLDIHFEDNIS